MYSKVMVYCVSLEIYNEVWRKVMEVHSEVM